MARKFEGTFDVRAECAFELCSVSRVKEATNTTYRLTYRKVDMLEPCFKEARKEFLRRFHKEGSRNPRNQLPQLAWR